MHGRMEDAMILHWLAALNAWLNTVTGADTFAGRATVSTAYLALFWLIPGAHQARRRFAAAITTPTPVDDDRDMLERALAAAEQMYKAEAAKVTSFMEIGSANCPRCGQWKDERLHR
jgi:hypothetical protein